MISARVRIGQRNHLWALWSKVCSLDRRSIPGLGSQLKTYQSTRYAAELLELKLVLFLKFQEGTRILQSLNRVLEKT